MREETKEWLASASEDREAAQVLFDAEQYHAMAQHAQQAAEGALKALLVERTGELPARTHDLRRIGTQVGVPPELLARLVELYAYYLAGRYPGSAYRDAQAVRAEAEAALATARDAVEWARGQVGSAAGG
jgi:HEPN domain-containing protein